MADAHKIRFHCNIRKTQSKHYMLKLTNISERKDIDMLLTDQHPVVNF